MILPIFGLFYFAILLFAIFCVDMDDFILWGVDRPFIFIPVVVSFFFQGIYFCINLPFIITFWINFAFH